jgi:hypothetical protein
MQQSASCWDSEACQVRHHVIQLRASWPPQAREQRTERGRDCRDATQRIDLGNGLVRLLRIRCRAARQSLVNHETKPDKRGHIDGRKKRAERKSEAERYPPDELLWPISSSLPAFPSCAPDLRRVSSMPAGLARTRRTPRSGTRQSRAIRFRYSDSSRPQPMPWVFWRISKTVRDTLSGRADR